MATLAQLRERQSELQDRLEKGDLSAEDALERVDAAIRARSKTIQHSQQRLKAVKDAVAKGVPVADAKAVKSRSKTRQNSIRKANRPINRFD